MIFTNPALCSENSLKFSTKSSSRGPSGLAMPHVPRSITSTDTRRGSSSRSMRLLPVRKHLEEPLPFRRERADRGKSEVRSANSERVLPLRLERGQGRGEVSDLVRIPKFSQFDNRKSAFVISTPH